MVIDLADAPASGEVRVAPKVLQSSASDLARSSSYTFGLFGVERVGVSAGLNSQPEQATAAAEGFVAEIRSQVEAGALYFDEGKGVPSGALSSLRHLSPLDALAGSKALAVASMVNAVGWALDGNLEGATVAVEAQHLAPAGLIEALGQAGLRVVEVEGVAEKPWLVWGADVDVIMAGSKPGVLTHQGAPLVKAKAIVPWGPIPVTTKAFAQLRRDNVALIPDFVALAGARLGGWAGDELDSAIDAINTKMTTLLDQGASHRDGLFLAMCYQAEEFIGWWRGVPPFGRPLAA